MTKQLLIVVRVLALGVVVQTEQFGADAPYTIAYASFAPLNSAVFIADANGSHARVLVEHPALDSNPTFSPDGRWVLFTSRRDGSAEIYRVHLDGTGLERLTNNSAFDDQAVMSPDGNRVAFVSSRSGQADIWIVELRTKRLRNLTNHPGGDYRPAWSPDEQWIAFTSDRKSPGARANTPRSKGGFAPPQSTEIYLIRADGSALRQLTNSAAAVGGATWSPDGKRVAFYEASPSDWQAMGRDFGGAAASSQIVSLDIATGAREILTKGPGRKFAPKWIAPLRIGYVRGPENERVGVRQKVNYPIGGVHFTYGSAGLDGEFAAIDWSPDRKNIVFQRELERDWPSVLPAYSADPQFRLVRTGVFPTYSPDGKRLAAHTGLAAIFHNTIVVMNADGTNRRAIFEDPSQNAVAPAWSPSGDRIAFGLGLYNTGTNAGIESHVVTVNLDGSDLRSLTSDSHGNYGFPSWSPDGKQLVYRASEGRGRSLMIIDVASRSRKTLTPTGANDNFPAWSPKGDLIVFTSDRDGDWELYTIRPDGSGLKRLTYVPGNDAHPSWSPDGNWIAFASARGGFKDEMARGVGGGQGAGDIFVMRFDGSDVRRLTDDSSEEATPAFKPK